jgi:hypothetical protein
VTKSLAIVIGEYKAGGAGADRSEKIWKNVDRQAGNIRVYVTPPRLRTRNLTYMTRANENHRLCMSCVWACFALQSVSRVELHICFWS